MDKNSWSARMDHHFIERNRIFVRFSYDDTPLNRAPVYGPRLHESRRPRGRRCSLAAIQCSKTAHVLPDAAWHVPLFVDTADQLPPAILGQLRHRVPWSAVLYAAGDGGPDLAARHHHQRLQCQGSVANMIVGGFIGATDLISFGSTTHSFMGNVTKCLRRTR